MAGRARVATTVRRGAPRLDAAVNRQGDPQRVHTANRTPRGGSGAHPTYPLPDRQDTHAGPHMVPGTQAQLLARATQRP